VPLQFFVLLVLAAAATVFSVLTSIIVVIRKVLDGSRARARERLYRIYSAKCSELLLYELPPLPAGSKQSHLFNQYETLTQPIKRSLQRLTRRRQEVHRNALRLVLTDMAKDLTGESSSRLTYAFDSFGFVEVEMGMLRSRHWWRRAEAARLLGVFGARKSINFLQAALRDIHPVVRHQVMQSLAKLVGPPSLGTIFKLSSRMPRWTAIELSVIVAEFKESAAPYLIEALKSTDQSVVLFAEEMLGTIGFIDAVPPLLDLARSSRDTAIVAGAVKALGRIGDERALPLAMDMMRSMAPHVRLSAFEAVGRIAGGDALEKLEPNLMHNRTEEKLAAGRAMAAIGGEGIAKLKKIAEEVEGMTGAIAAQVLEEHEKQRTYA
jgi:HEAT repeat protein